MQHIATCLAVHHFVGALSGQEEREESAELFRQNNDLKNVAIRIVCLENAALVEGYLKHARKRAGSNCDI